MEIASMRAMLRRAGALRWTRTGGRCYLRTYFEGCHAEVTWDLVKGADHAHEEAALTRKKANAILDWLAAKRRSTSVAKPLATPLK